MSMQPFHLADEWTSPEDERALVAAVAKNPALYWELLDLLSPQRPACVGYGRCPGCRGSCCQANSTTFARDPCST